MSVAISKGPHLDDTSGDTQLMIGNLHQLCILLVKRTVQL